MHYFSTLFGNELYMFRTDLLSVIRSRNTVFTAIGICHTGYVDCVLADSQHNQYDKYQFLWWWTVNLSETYRVVYQNKVEK